MSDPIVVIDRSEIRAGKLDELRAALRELTEFVERNEPRPILYHAYISEDGSRMTVLQVHPDPSSMEFHMEVAGAAFPRFRELLHLRTMDVYGEPSDRLLEALRAKASMLGDATVAVHRLQSGFTRLASP